MNALTAAWTVLIVAGLFEIAWPIGLKMSQSPGQAITGIVVAVVGMGVSGWLLWLAQKQIPIGTAYAVWTGIGAAGAFFVGIWIYKDPASLMRFLGVALIVGGVIVLKVSH